MPRHSSHSVCIHTTTLTVRALPQIDVNGDATMEWDEFTSFIIDSGVSGPANDPVGVEQYLPSAWEDTHKHVGIIEQLYYWPECDIVSAARPACSGPIRLIPPPVCAASWCRSPPASAAAAPYTCTGRRTWASRSPSRGWRATSSPLPSSQRSDAARTPFFTLSHVLPCPGGPSAADQRGCDQQQRPADFGARSGDGEDAAILPRPLLPNLPPGQPVGRV